MSITSFEFGLFAAVVILAVQLAQRLPSRWLPRVVLLLANLYFLSTFASIGWVGLLPVFGFVLACYAIVGWLLLRSRPATLPDPAGGCLPRLLLDQEVPLRTGGLEACAAVHDDRTVIHVLPFAAAADRRSQRQCEGPAAPSGLFELPVQLSHPGVRPHPALRSVHRIAGRGGPHRLDRARAGDRAHRHRCVQGDSGGRCAAGRAPTIAGRPCRRNRAARAGQSACGVAGGSTRCTCSSISRATPTSSSAWGGCWASNCPRTSIGHSRPATSWTSGPVGT